MPVYDPALYRDDLSELPAEVEVAATALKFLRELRPILASLSTMQTTTWQAWGTVFTELQTWLSTPIASIGKTPLQVLMTRYVAEEQ